MIDVLQLLKDGVLIIHVVQPFDEVEVDSSLEINGEPYAWSDTPDSLLTDYERSILQQIEQLIDQGIAAWTHYKKYSIGGAQRLVLTNDTD
jgi:hypothetical protein